VPEYRHLRAASGLKSMTEAQSAAVPNGTWFGCHITYESAAVAMWRIISDGGWYFVISDMAVLPKPSARGSEMPFPSTYWSTSRTMYPKESLMSR
jgi:hypothetical protein